MGQVTYLFGAGASIERVPIQTQMAERIESLRHVLESENLNFNKINDNTLAQQFTKVKEDVIIDLQWLEEIVRTNKSVDAHAHRLRIAGNREQLRKLKNIYSTFFVLHQAQEPSTDGRYLPFLNNIFKSSLQFPKDLKILSWNYDFQFEKTLSSYRENSTQRFELKTIQDMFGIYTGGQDHSGLNYNIFKLNGSAGYENINFTTNDDFHIPLKPDGLDLNFLEFVLRNYSKVKTLGSNHNLSLQFAFDDIDHRLRMVKEATSRTQILIIIGYSFPDVNRVFDSEVINNMKGLDKVYIQNPKADDLKKEFELHFGTDHRYSVESINSTEKFHIPNELLRR